MTTRPLIPLDAALADYDLACTNLVRSLRTKYKAGQIVLAQMQRNHPPQKVTVENVLADRPGYLRVSYPGGHPSAVHCRDVQV